MVLNAILLALAAMVLFLVGMGVIFIAIKIHQERMEAEDGALDLLRTIDGLRPERTLLDLQSAAAEARAGAGEGELEKQTGAGRSGQDDGEGGIGGGARGLSMRSE